MAKRKVATTQKPTRVGKKASKQPDCDMPAGRKTPTKSRRYLRLKSVRLLRKELDTAGVRSKRRVGADGTSSGNQRFSQGALYLLLQNRTYRGEATHKGNAYPGEHAAIVDKALWDSVQAVLTENRVVRTTGINTKAPSLLTGVLFDETGERLTPTWSVKNGTRIGTTSPPPW